MLTIKNLKVKRGSKLILNRVNLDIKLNEIHAIMGPNGSGKSTLANAIMGNPETRVIGGTILLNNININKLSVTDRAKMGIFMAFQYPVEVSGVPVIKFLKMVYEERFNEKISAGAFLKLLNESTKLLNIKNDLITRYLNDGFSGGEKKKLEILQMSIIQPKICILDETDRGLDISALRDVALGVKKLQKKFSMGILVITHYSRILRYLNPSHVHILQDGEIAKSGGIELVERLESYGYEEIFSARN